MISGGLQRVGGSGAQRLGQEIQLLQGSGDVPAGLGHGLIDPGSHGIAEKAGVDLGGQCTAAPDGNADAQHRADQLGQTGEKALLPAFYSGKRKDGKKEKIIDKRR